MAKRMAEQMELFEPVERGFDEGGLMEEGGMVDEESGNEVPPGSLREEVRDDIPAQLSEGEFVFPADVVRYIGLENLMRMRQEAKQGLAQMEAMGQMGNGDEAVMPDDLPFDEYDLEVEDDGLQMNVGGYVPPSVPQQPYNQPTQVDPRTGTYTLPGTGIAGYQVPSGTPTGYTPYGGAQPYFQPVQFTGAQYQTALQTTNLPTFAETVGSKPGQYDELRTYINDAGQTLQIPFKDGRPIYPIPEGYRPIGDQPAPEEEAPTTVTPTLGQAQVRDDGGRDEAGPPTGTKDVTGIGYNRNGLTDSLKSVVSEFGAGFGTLKDALNPQSYSQVANKLGIIDGVPQKTSAITSASLGGVFDNFRGVTVTVDPRFGNVRTYENNTPLDQLSVQQQNTLAQVSRATVSRIQGIITEDGEALNSADTQAALENELASSYGLSKSEIDDIANVGGNYNQNQKLARHLAGLIAKDETRDIAQDKFGKAKGRVDAGLRTEDLDAKVFGRGDSGSGTASGSGRETRTSKDLASGVGVRSEDRDAAQASRDSGGGGRSGEGLDSTGRADI